MGTEESSRRRGAHLGPSLRCAYLWLHRLPNQNLTFRDTWASVSRAYALDFNTASSEYALQWLRPFGATSKIHIYKIVKLGVTVCITKILSGFL